MTGSINNLIKPFSPIIISIIFIALTLPVTGAHGNEAAALHQDLMGDSVYYIVIASIIAAVAIIISVLMENKLTKKEKVLLYSAIAVPVILATGYLTFSTIYLNLISDTGGPVHWHADFEIWLCGEPVDIKDPEGFENRIGSPVIHEHSDNRIHIEGVLENIEQATLENFFAQLGGFLREDAIRIPANDGIKEVRDGDDCNGRPGKLQAFVYRTQGNTFSQQQLEDFEHYILSPHSNVPPGDCIIIEFDSEKSRTQHLCTSYLIDVKRGKIKEV